MKKLLILGAGGHGAVTLDAALSMSCWDAIHFLDDDAQKTAICEHYKVLGKIEVLAQHYEPDTEVIIGIGNNHIRSDLKQTFLRHDYVLATVCHQTSVISRFSKIEAGSVVFAYAVVNPRVLIKEGCIINTSAVIEHDCKLEPYVHVAPNATLCGNVNVGALSWIGAGAIVRENITIGENVIVGAGAVVVKDIPSNTVVVGIPARESK